MTQKETVLGMLKAAGSFGVRSDIYIKDYMPRAAARIQDLKDEGHNITSEREGKYTRWTLVPGGRATPEAEERSVQQDNGASLPRESFTERSVPSMFDADADWNNAA